MDSVSNRSTMGVEQQVPLRNCGAHNNPPGPGSLGICAKTGKSIKILADSWTKLPGIFKFLGGAGITVICVGATVLSGGIVPLIITLGAAILGLSLFMYGMVVADVDNFRTSTD